MVNLFISTFNTFTYIASYKLWKFCPGTNMMQEAIAQVLEDQSFTIQTPEATEA